MTTEQLMRLHKQAARLYIVLHRNLIGWAPEGMDMQKLARIVDKASRRCHRRHSALIARLASEEAIQ